MAKVHISRVEIEKDGVHVFLSDGDELCFLQSLEYNYIFDGVAKVKLEALVERIVYDE